MIQSGEIAERMDEAIQVKGNNFIDWRNVDNFREALQERPVEAGRAIYDLFCGSNDDAALEGIVSFMGSRNYDLISTLFFMKNWREYFPCRPLYFRKAFIELGMDTECLTECTYGKYMKFNSEIRELARFFSDYAGHIDVIDAHSFAWIIGANDDARAYIFDGQHL